MSKSKLYNLSKFATAYIDESGKTLRGVVISGFVKEEGKKPEYANIWVKKGDIYNIATLPDGGKVIMIKLLDVSNKQAKKEEPKASNPLDELKNLDCPF